MAVTINTITNLDKLSLINSNFTKLATAINQSLVWRTGSVAGETTFSRDLDLNGHQILNAYVGTYSLDEVVTIANTANDSAIAAAASAVLASQSAAGAVTSATAAAASAALAAQSAGTVAGAVTYITPEMYGAKGDGSVDDSAAIVAAMAAARTKGVDRVVGYGIYKVAQNMTIYPGFHASPATGGESRFGFELFLNVLIVDSNAWPAVPDEWWTATPVFTPGVGTEAIHVHVNQFDGGGKATFLNTVGASLGTSHIHVGQARNYILIFRNYMNVAGQGTMNYITGENWQDGYLPVLLGAGVGGANSECHNVDVNWLANNRYGGISLQDRSQYSHIKGGTVDFNGKWMSALTLTNISADTGFEVVFGNPVTNGTITRYAMSSIMNNDRTKILMVAENSDRLNGTSDFVVGDTISYNGWSATISAIEVCSDVTYNYFDIIVCNRSGDFSKCTITPSYLGGWKGHNKFTNFVLCNNSSATIDAMDIKGLSLTGGSNSSFWYLKHLYGTNQIFGFYNNNMTIDLSVEMGEHTIYGRKGAYSVAGGGSVTLTTFSAASDETAAAYYRVTVGSSTAGQYASAVVRVGVSGLVITESSAYANIALSVSGLSLIATTAGADSVITFAGTRII